MEIKNEILSEIKRGGFTPLFLRGAMAIMRGQVDSITAGSFMAALNEAEREYERLYGNAPIRGPF